MNEEWEAITSQTLQAPDDAANETSSEARWFSNETKI